MFPKDDRQRQFKQPLPQDILSEETGPEPEATSMHPATSSTRRKQSVAKIESGPHTIITATVPVTTRRKTARGLSRRTLLSWGVAATGAAVAAKLLRFSPEPYIKALGIEPPPIGGTMAQVRKSPLGYFHGFFEVNSPQEIADAASLGVNYTINYGDNSWSAADPTTAMGQAMTQYGMKTFLNVELPYLDCGTLDEEGVRNLVTKFYTSPLVAGYWTKDDDCGDELDAVLRIAQIIRSIDTNPEHLIMPGFGDAGSVQRNYAPGQGDLLGFYPYPAYSRGPALEVPDMVRIVQQRTPAGQKPPLFIGIYQDFATPPERPLLPTSNVLDQVMAFLANGAAGVAGFGWEAPNEDLVVSNNATLRQSVGAVTDWLGKNGYGSRAG